MQADIPISTCVNITDIKHIFCFTISTPGKVNIAVCYNIYLARALNTDRQFFINGNDSCFIIPVNSGSISTGKKLKILDIIAYTCNFQFGNFFAVQTCAAAANINCNVLTFNVRVFNNIIS